VVGLAYVLSGSALAAEDIAQEAFLAASMSWDRVGRYDNPGAWVRKVVANMACKAVRRRMAEARALARSVLRSGDGVQVAELPTEHAEVWSAVRTLPRRQAQVIALHYQADYSVREVAQTLGISEGAVKKHLHDARHTLAQRLGTLPEADR
jgi:RNA polymerase sigma-70 factor (ECF subfamily)